MWLLFFHTSKIICSVQEGTDTVDLESFVQLIFAHLEDKDLFIEIYHK